MIVIKEFAVVLYGVAIPPRNPDQLGI